MKKLLIWINVSSIALIILGLIHLLATFSVIPMFNNLDKEQFSVFMFMYLTAGVATILPGLLSSYLVKPLKSNDKMAWVVILICSVFTSIVGIAAVGFMAQNPFAYLMLLIGFSLLIPTLFIKKFIDSSIG